MKRLKDVGGQSGCHVIIFTYFEGQRFWAVDWLSRTRRAGRPSGRRPSRKVERSKSRIYLCRIGEYRLSFAAAKDRRGDQNRAEFIRLSVKKRVLLGEILPKNQGLSPIRKSFTRLAAATTNAANRVGHAIASGGLTASSN